MLLFIVFIATMFMIFMPEIFSIMVLMLCYGMLGIGFILFSIVHPFIAICCLAAIIILGESTIRGKK